jgi:hypothetical protein
MYTTGHVLLSFVTFICFCPTLQAELQRTGSTISPLNRISQAISLSAKVSFISLNSSLSTSMHWSPTAISLSSIPLNLASTPSKPKSTSFSTTSTSWSNTPTSWSITHTISSQQTLIVPLDEALEDLFRGGEGGGILEIACGTRRRRLSCKREEKFYLKQGLLVAFVVITNAWNKASIKEITISNAYQNVYLIVYLIVYYNNYYINSVFLLDISKRWQQFSSKCKFRENTPTTWPAESRLCCSSWKWCCFLDSEAYNFYCCNS